MRRREQARDHLAILQVRLDDFVNVVLVHIAVPNPPGRPQPLGRPHSDPDTRLYSPALGRASQTSSLDLGLFAAVERSLGMVLRTTGFPVRALVETKKIWRW